MQLYEYDAVNIFEKRNIINEQEKNTFQRFLLVKSKLNKIKSTEESRKKSLNQKQGAIFLDFENKLKKFEDFLDSKIKDSKIYRIKQAKEDLASFEADNNEEIESLYLKLESSLNDEVLKQRIEEIKELDMKNNQERILNLCEKYIKKIETKHYSTFIRLQSVLGCFENTDKDFISLLLKSQEDLDNLNKGNTKNSKEKKSKQISEAQSLFDKARRILEEAILFRKGNFRIKKPREIIPWKIYENGINYKAIFKYFSNNLRTLKSIKTKRAESLVSKIENLILYDKTVFRLVGSEYVKTNKGVKVKSNFWSLFDKRVFNDKHGITDKLIKTKEEKKKRRKEKKI